MESFNCKITKIIKQNKETGFIIAGAKPINYDLEEKYLTQYGTFTIIGTGFLSEDMEYEITGEWKTNNYGYNFNLVNYNKILPSNKDAIIVYLQRFDGIGLSTAKKIVKVFGEETLDVMEHNIEKLITIRGISANKLEKIRASFVRSKNFEELCTFLFKYNISASKVGEIYSVYADNSQEVILNNPYELCLNVKNISFNLCDKIAKELGFSFDYPARISTGIICLMKYECNNNGHMFLYKQQLKEKFNSFFPSINNLLLEEGLIRLEQQGLITIIKDNKIVNIDNKHNDVLDRIYLKEFKNIEDNICNKTLALVTKSNKIKNLDKIIENIENRENVQYDEIQKKGIEVINSGSNLNIITGGPGTGKTTILKAILKVFEEEGIKDILLAAPTGRASKRMEEATGHKASTIHRLLKYNPVENRFEKNEDDPLETSVLLIDESSMIDAILFNNLLKAIKIGTKVFLIGDIHQLPPVGLGYIFRDLIESNIVPTIELQKVYRQGEGSIIPTNAQRINKGELVLKAAKGFFEIGIFQPKPNKSELPSVKDYLINTFINYYKIEQEKIGDKAIYEVQILTPMKKGFLGTININKIIQNVYNPPSETKEEIVFNNRKGEEKDIYRVGDKVIQIENDYDKEVFNGDLGIIYSIKNTFEGKVMTVIFEDGREVEYKKDEIKASLLLAYAITVHKSQGSEFNRIIVLCSYLHTIMRQRNLLYTAVTRAKKTVSLMGDKASIKLAIQTIDNKNRNTGLTQKLIDGVGDNNKEIA